MPEHQREIDQTEWVSLRAEHTCGVGLMLSFQRVEEFGYDKDERQYYLLDDNRFYRRTDPPLPAVPKAKPKANSKKAIAARRRESKRRKIEAQTPEIEDDNQENNEETQVVEEKNLESWEIDTFGGFKWECIAITLGDYQELCESLKKSKDPNEKALRDRLLEEVIPIIEAAEEKQRRKIERRERELLMMERMVGAKRSSRLADKQEREKKEAEEAEADRKRQADLAAAHKEQEKQEKMEQERQYRMMTREQRIKDREFKRLLKEEELARDALEQKRIEDGEIRSSGRHLQERIERNQKELEDLNAEEEWTFDCSGCGIHGKNLVSKARVLHASARLTVSQDDGSHSVACDRCNVWQHSKCLGISKSAAEKDDFHFICNDCKRKEEDAKKPKISLKFRVGTSSSPVPPSPAPAKVKTKSPRKPKASGVDVPKDNTTRPPSQGSTTNGYQFQQYSPPSQPSSSPFRASPAPQSGFYSYQHPQQAYGFPQQRPTSSSPQQQLNSLAPVYGAHPPYSGHSYPNAPTINNGPTGSPPVQATGQHPPYYNGVPYQYRAYNAPGQRPLAPSPNPQSASQTPNGLTMTNSGRLPSPVVNRPTMSPTQGNMDVGPVAGISQRSPPTNAQTLNGSGGSTNGAAPGSFNHGPQATPRAPPHQQTHQTPTPATQPLSGLSPKKHHTPSPLLPPTMVAPKASTIPPPPIPTAPHSGATGISTNGPTADKPTSTVLPPVENLRPSPEQLKKMSSVEPVPTPSKQPQPVPHTEPVQAMSLSGENGSTSKTPNIVQTTSVPNPNPSTQPKSEAGQASIQPNPEIKQAATGTEEVKPPAT